MGFGHPSAGVGLQKRKSKPRGIAKRALTHDASFLTKFWTRILTNENYADIIGWNTDGTHMVVPDKAKLARAAQKEGVVGRGVSYDSLARQLRVYRFNRDQKSDKALCGRKGWVTWRHINGLHRDSSMKDVEAVSRTARQDPNGCGDHGVGPDRMIGSQSNIGEAPVAQPAHSLGGTSSQQSLDSRSGGAPTMQVVEEPFFQASYVTFTAPQVTKPSSGLGLYGAMKPLAVAAREINPGGIEEQLSAAPLPQEASAPDLGTMQQDDLVPTLVHNPAPSEISSEASLRAGTGSLESTLTPPVNWAEFVEESLWKDY